jgi:hypothetical protein
VSSKEPLANTYPLTGSKRVVPNGVVGLSPVDKTNVAEDDENEVVTLADMVFAIFGPNARSDMMFQQGRLY